MIIEATVKLYNNVTELFLPTPTKSHYLFNIRDFSRVIQGILLFKAKSLIKTHNNSLKIHENSMTLIRLWAHESFRVFADRLTEWSDQELFFKKIKAVVESEFKERFENVFENILSKAIENNRKNMAKNQQPVASELKNLVEQQMYHCLYFTDFLLANSKSSPLTENKLYEEVNDFESLKRSVENYLVDYNMLSKVPMDLVIFEFLIEHISKINRILKLSNGHGLLIGMEGMGRSSASKLAAFIANYNFFQIEPTKKYTISDWKTDLKFLLRKAGEQGTKIVFFFSDHQIKDEEFLENINSLLNSGDVPMLFENEEKVDIIDKVRDKLKKFKFRYTVYIYFKLFN